MESIREIYRRLFGHRYLFSDVDRFREPRAYTKHNASKRGHKHSHRMSRGERNHAAFMKGGTS